jgi:hypothetical protein
VTKYCYLLTEGAQDITFLIKLLKYDGMKQIEKRSNVDRFWDDLIPTTFPHNDELNRQVPVPKFLEGNGISIALQGAVGDTRLVNTIQEDLALITQEQLFGIGIILDADNIEPQERFDKIKTELEKLQLGLDIAIQPGIVTQSKNKFGIFVLPDNQSKGTLESILIECGEHNYEHLMELSREYISKIDESKLRSSDLKELRKPAGKNKALIGGVSNILKPGRTLQVSLQDNDWIDRATLDLAKIKLMREFLADIIDINLRSSEG